ncbi:MAG TPA: hypothetical protein VJ739_14330 [Gemmataceae bacterium]|nr:hypothetical protein [Gemmataceae bacterium]
MWRRVGVAVLLLLAPAVGRAADAPDVPERLLPAETQIYLRWDGVAAHRAAYEKTALGRTLQGDLGKFVASVFAQGQDLLGGAVVQQLLQGVPPDKLQKIQADAAEAPKLVHVLAKHGVILAVEVHSLQPPQAQVTLVFPNAGDDAKPLLATLRLATALSKTPVQERKVQGRTLYQLAAGPVPVAWWVEGKHVILTGGTRLPETTLRQLDKGPRLTDNPLFRRVAGFKDFETGARAFVDVAGLAKITTAGNPAASGLLKDLGVDGIKGLTAYSGFAGAAERDLVEMELTGQRKGVLAMLTGKPFTLADVPPLPADSTTWAMTHFDAKTAYDEGLRAAEGVLRVVAPDQATKLQEFVKQANEGLGVDLRQDVLGSLGEQMVQYSTPSEGALFFGQTYLLKVKDPKKLQDSLDQALKGLGKLVNVNITVRKRAYHGAELHEVHVRQQGFFFLPTFVVHKGWLALSYYPQAVQGYVLRTNGELPAWKPGARTRAALEQLPKEFLSISVSDPRPGVRLVLSLAPLIGASVNSALPDSKFDVGLVPNGNEVARHLFPNVTVAALEGNTLRLESRASLALPLDLGNTDTLFGAGLLIPFLARVAK